MKKILIVDSTLDLPSADWLALARALTASGATLAVPAEQTTVPKLEEFPKLTIPAPIAYYPPCEHHSPWPPTIKRRKLKGYQK